MRFRQKPTANSQQPTTLLGWLVAAVGTAVYLLTLEPTVSFWDCGEFIATSHKLQVGHPPGAPLYSLLAHCMMLLAGGNVTRLAWWSNSLSALAGGLTAMFLFWTLVRLLTLANSQQPTANSQWPIIFSALIGTACYLFCDTAWFSATESEVYSLSMLFSSMILWASLRWIQEDDTRWFLLMVMLLGLSLGVHILSLLTIPVIIVARLTLKKPKANLQPSKFKIQNSKFKFRPSKFKIQNS